MRLDVYWIQIYLYIWKVKLKPTLKINTKSLQIEIRFKFILESYGLQNVSFDNETRI